jgi:magnesium-transporting ATPase (P-type)
MTDRIIDAPMKLGVVFMGLLMALATLFVLDMELPGGLVEGSSTLREARTMAFTTLVLAQLFNCFNARWERESAFRNLFTNRLLWAAVALSLLLQIGVVYLPFLQPAFGTTALEAEDWSVCIAMASTVLWAEELRKVLVRRRGPVSR